MAWVYMPEHYKSLVEGFGVCALLHLPVAHEVVKKMKYLPKESSVTLESVLKNRNAYGWCPIRLQCVSFRIGDSGNSTVIPTKNIKPGILYIPTLFEFDVIDAFYFVEVLRPDTTGDVPKNNSRLTLVFVRVPRERDTALTTSRVAAFIRRMKECMDGWEQLTNEIAFEMLYLRHTSNVAINRRQTCALAIGETRREHLEAHAFWENMEQFEVELGDVLVDTLVNCITERW
ncbi:hypothetical protein, conserved in T. vivax [Trypanosoma vivax Y486]|uniref:Retrotransposon hot spot (RHS) protein n=1 Tax=Trypanosoma vivax (strain Y486) TaxID=1055687 RepID=F9WNK2_TRYVY|nr:hypothetical protein, conserved in T. vivax [Trypanosoma vivax Y486]|eukprot:CCD19120.1 hypothetical protein, conserved in T. vivax [Trypanosoma vivax Y486]